MRFARKTTILQAMRVDAAEKQHDVTAWPPAGAEVRVEGPPPSWPGWTDRPIPCTVADGPPPPSRRSFLGLMVAGGAGGSAAAVAALGSDAPGPLRAAFDRMTAIAAEVRRIEAESCGGRPGITPESEAKEARLDEALDRAAAISRALVELVLARSGMSLHTLVITQADEDSPRAVASAREGRLVVAVTISAGASWMFDVTGANYCVRPTFMELPGVES